MSTAVQAPSTSPRVEASKEQTQSTGAHGKVAAPACATKALAKPAKGPLQATSEPKEQLQVTREGAGAADHGHTSKGAPKSAAEIAAEKSLNARKLLLAVETLVSWSRKAQPQPPPEVRLAVETLAAGIAELP